MKEGQSVRKLVWFGIGFTAACFLGAVFYGGWLLLCAVISLVLSGLLMVFAKGWEKGAFLRVIVIGCTAGFLWFGIYDALFVMIPRIADGARFAVTMEATDYSYETDYGSAVEGNVVINEREYRVKAYLHSKDQIAPGDTVTGTFRFRLTTDGGLDEPTHHRTEGIFLLAYPAGSVTVQKTGVAAIEHYPAIWRHQILNRISEIFPNECGAFAAALLLGDRSGITYEMNTSFKVSGISHVIAVSGLHVSILFGLLYTLLARRRVLSCLVGIPVLVLFAAMVGFSPSITRACIMQSLMLIAMVMDREYDGPTALSFAVLVMLIVNPLTVLSVSFQLSVGCMMGIFLFSERIRKVLLEYGKKYIKKDRKLLNRAFKGIAASVSVSLGATVLTAPLVAYYFGCVSIIGIVTNILTLWAISFIFYGITACLIVSICSVTIAQVLAAIVGLLIQFVLNTAELIAQLPMAAIYISNLYIVFWLVGAYLLLIIFLLQQKKEPALLIVSLVFTLLTAQLFSWLEPLQDDFRVTMLDVGQGQSILLQSDGKTFLVDCGGDDSEDAADITAEALLSQGISRLDGVIVTHYDADHAGGIAYLLSRIQTDRLILPYVNDVPNSFPDMSEYTVDFVHEDMIYTFADTKLTIFAPISHHSDNENSICILFQREDYDILITGDRGALGEKMLLQDHALPEVDVLVVGHHGSAGSTTEELLAAVSPQIALISVGEDNRYGHPSGTVLERLYYAGCEIYRTDIHGTIVFRR